MNNYIQRFLLEDLDIRGAANVARSQLSGSRHPVARRNERHYAAAGMQSQAAWTSHRAAEEQWSSFHAGH